MTTCGEVKLLSRVKDSLKLTIRWLSMDIIPLVSANKMTTCGEVSYYQGLKTVLNWERVFSNFVDKVKTEYASSF